MESLIVDVALVPYRAKGVFKTSGLGKFAVFVWFVLTICLLIILLNFANNLPAPLNVIVGFICFGLTAVISGVAMSWIDDKLNPGITVPK